MTETGTETKQVSKGKNIGMAIVAYIIFFIPLLTEAKKDPFVKYHVKQGLVLFIAWIIVGMLGYFLPWGVVDDCTIARSGTIRFDDNWDNGRG